MDRPDFPTSVKEIARNCAVDLLSEECRGWRIRECEIIAPQGWTISRGDACCGLDPFLANHDLNGGADVALIEHGFASLGSSSSALSSALTGHGLDQSLTRDLGAIARLASAARVQECDQLLAHRFARQRWVHRQ